VLSILIGGVSRILDVAANKVLNVRFILGICRTRIFFIATTVTFILFSIVVSLLDGRWNVGQLKERDIITLFDLSGKTSGSGRASNISIG